MTYNEFNAYLNKVVEEYVHKIECMETLIITIKYKYDWEKEYRITNEILQSANCEYCWLSDWWEGEEDIELLGIIALSEVETNPIQTIFN